MKATVLKTEKDRGSTSVIAWYLDHYLVPGAGICSLFYAVQNAYASTPI